MAGKILSRRDFLKLGGASLLGLLHPLSGWMQALARPASGFTDLNPDQQGRVVEGNITVYDRPSFSGKEVKMYWRDAVLPITDVTVGDENPPYNRVWYRLGEDGYAHSGSIQPVRTSLNLPVADLSPDGTWAEVTVPFTDCYWGLGNREPFAYRFYYGTTHWVNRLLQDVYGDPWYRVFDDKFKFQYYVPAPHLRILPLEELGLSSADVPQAEKRIEVRLAEQVLIAYERESPIFMARTATGAKFRDGNFTTPIGRHFTFSKRPGRHMAAGDLASNGYDLPGVPWICYITENGLAIHGTYWHNDFGKVRSHGCVNLTPQAAKWVYRWTQPVVPPHEQSVYETYGTVVDVIGEPE